MEAQKSELLPYLEAGLPHIPIAPLRELIAEYAIAWHLWQTDSSFINNESDADSVYDTFAEFLNDRQRDTRWWGSGISLQVGWKWQASYETMNEYNLTEELDRFTDILSGNETVDDALRNAEADYERKSVSVVYRSKEYLIVQHSGIWNCGDSMTKVFVTRADEDAVRAYLEKEARITYDSVRVTPLR
jgi:hypothetical protein